MVGVPEIASGASAVYWRRVALAVLVWTAALAVSLGGAAVDLRDQSVQLRAIRGEVEALGGIDIARRVDPYFTLIDANTRHNIAVHATLWLLGTAAIAFFARRNRRHTLERAATESAMRDDANEFRTTMEATTVGVFRIKNLRFDYVNPAMVRMFGYPPEEFTGGVAPMDIVIPEEREWVRQNTLKRASGEPGHPYQITCLRKDGSRFNGLVWSNRIFYRGVPTTVGSILDISERIRAEEELHHAMDKLAASNMELERFAYVASHDLQEPLRTITSFAQLLERRAADKLDSETKEYLDYIIAGGKRMHALVNDLLTYSRVSSKGTPFMPTDSEASLRTALQNLRDSIEESGADLRIGPLPLVMSDGMQVMQLFQNLIGNALKFRRRGIAPVIRVEARRSGDEVVFSVTDNGIGIAAEHLDRVFAVFRRLHHSEVYPGTGIGLAICKRIVDRHGGRIWIESVEGQGSTFFFTLPACDAEAETPTPRPADA